MNTAKKAIAETWQGLYGMMCSMSNTSISLPKIIKKQTQILFDAEGQPVSVLLPFGLFAKLLPNKLSVQEILEESSQTAKKAKVKLSDLLAAAEEVRQELFLERYSQ